MRYFLEIAYDGTNYCGWQYQPNAITVQEVLTKALHTIIKDNSISLVGCGRTDTGVHASQFFVHFDTKEITEDLEFVSFKLNKVLPVDIAVKKLFAVDDKAHARFSATSRTYQYFIHQQKNPFKEKYSLLLERKLDLKKMVEAASLLPQFDDFTSFARLNSNAKTNLCKVFYAHFTETENGLVFEIKANRFLRNMVRSLVGTLLHVGLNKITIEEFVNVINKKNRSEAGESVDGRGLFLTKIEYPFLNE
ncbi:MAG: tRNA pseudouridine(38-40) synthase TruA [Bacteroidia bacterium]